MNWETEGAKDGVDDAELDGADQGKVETDHGVVGVAKLEVKRREKWLKPGYYCK